MRLGLSKKVLTSWRTGMQVPCCAPSPVFTLERGFPAAQIISSHPYTLLDMFENSKGLDPFALFEGFSTV